MNLRKLLRILLVTVVVLIGILITLALLWNTFLFWAGGYWENSPLFDRISGPMRFRQFVADPIPATVYAVRKGYSGFPRGRIATYFQYRGEFGQYPFLNGWNEIPLDPFDHSSWPGFQLTKKFEQTQTFSDGSENHRYLLVDERSKKGVLYIPG